MQDSQRSDLDRAGTESEVSELKHVMYGYKSTLGILFVLDLSGGQRIQVSKPLLGTATSTRTGGTWGANAADMANILYQEPVMVGIHGREMLKNLVPPN